MEGVKGGSEGWEWRVGVVGREGVKGGSRGRGGSEGRE